MALTSKMALCLFLLFSTMLLCWANDEELEVADESPMVANQERPYPPRLGANTLHRLFDVHRRMDSEDMMAREARLTKNANNADRVALAMSRPLVAIGRR